MPKSTLIADTTLQERVEIVRKWIPADEGLDGCDIDLWDFYDDYIKGKKEIAECNAAFAEELEIWSKGAPDSGTPFRTIVSGIWL